MNPVDVLLVEDCAGDALLACQILAEFPMPLKVHIALDGHQALQMLAGGTFSPRLVLLDLTIPELSGLQVLERYSSPDIPVVVFTGSSRETDKRLAMALGASEYIEKPTDLPAFRNALWGSIERWVFGTSRRPPQNPA
jgi:CheY-like chemotaxis protein